MDTFTQYQELITGLVGRVLKIDSITVGNPGEVMLARYRGQLHKDSIEAYDQLAAALKPYRITPLFREDDGQHVVILTDGVIEPRPSNPWVNLILCILTVFSVLFAGTLYSYDGPLPDGNEIQQIAFLLGHLDAGIAFGASILAILLAHEFGHYLMARKHKVAVSLPYFIPLPISILGTMGAFISMKEPPKNRRTLHDIGVAGPLAGLAVAIPILFIGLALSPVDVIEPLTAGTGMMLEGNSILYLAAKYIVHGELLPAPQSYDGLSPVLYWLRFFFTGYPAPFGGRDVLMHPMAWAGWAGLLVTALNLIPAGQLDGGHALYVLFGRKASKALPVILIVLGVLGFFWSGWWFWAGLIFFLGRRYAEPLDQITTLDPRRRSIAILTLAIFVLVFIPIPLQQFFGP